KVADFFTAFVTNDVAQSPRIIALRTIFGIPHYFVNKVAEMQHEIQTILRISPFILPDHPAIGIRGALLHVLATHKREAHQPVISQGGRCQSSAHTAAKTVLVRKAIPVFASGFESRCEYATGPITLGRKRYLADSHNFSKS